MYEMREILMKDLEMVRSLSQPIPNIIIPQGYSIISVNEDNGYIWEEVMDASWGNHGPGAFRYGMVANNGFEDDKVFVMLDENNRPVATSSPWDWGCGNWYQEPLPKSPLLVLSQHAKEKDWVHSW
jgi:hypothetical protein